MSGHGIKLFGSEMPQVSYSSGEKTLSSARTDFDY